MRTAHVLSILSALGALAVAAPSAAQPAAPLAKPVAQAMTEKARQLFAEGVKAYQQSRWADAHASFLAAWALTKHYSIAGNLADCELRLGLNRDAAEHFALYAREMAKDSTSTPQERKDGDARYAQARAKVGQANVHVSLPGAEVYVDGKLIGTAPLEDPVFVDPGNHVIEARSEGYPPARANVDAIAGTATPVALTLSRAPEQPPTTPMVAPGLAWIVTTGALSLGAVGTGIGLAVAASSKGSDAATIGARLGGSTTCTGTPAAAVSADCAGVKSALQSKSTLSDGAFGAFLGGGVLALTAAGLGVWTAATPRAKDEPKAVLRVVPVASMRDAGVIVMGTW